MHSQIVRGEYGGMTSVALANRDGGVRLVLMEPVVGSSESQLETFLACNRGPGVQHLAFRTANIVETARNLARRGINFLPIDAGVDDEAAKAGAARVLHQLGEETASVLALLGCRSVADLRPAMVRS